MVLEIASVDELCDAITFSKRKTTDVDAGRHFLQMAVITGIVHSLLDSLSSMPLPLGFARLKPTHGDPPMIKTVWSLEL